MPHKQYKVTFTTRKSTWCWPISGSQEQAWQWCMTRLQQHDPSPFAWQGWHLRPWWGRAGCLPSLLRLAAPTIKWPGVWQWAQRDNDFLIFWNSRNFSPYTKITAEWALLTDPCLRRVFLEGTGSIIHSQRSDIAILVAGKTSVWVLQSREAYHNSTAPSMTNLIVMGRQQQTKQGFCTAYSGEKEGICSLCSSHIILDLKIQSPPGI